MNCANNQGNVGTSLEEKQYNLATCGDAYKFVARWYYIPIDQLNFDNKKDDKKIAERTKATMEELKARYDELLKGWVAETTFSVPVVGAVIDQNSMWMLADFGGFLFLTLLTLSFINESKCLSSIYPFVTRKIFAQMIVDGNVFSRPAHQRLFRLPIFWLFLFVPFAFSCALLGELSAYDFLATQLQESGFKRLWIAELFSVACIFAASVWCLVCAWEVDYKLQRIADKFPKDAQVPFGYS